MSKPRLKEDDIVLCIVKKIEGATVFVEIEGNGSGTIVLSEIAAGRIRNLRDYVSPNKRIVCKVLKISPANIELSLRRVTAGEREEALEADKKEKTLASILKTIVSNPKEIIEKIKESHSISDFLEEAREIPKLLEEFLTKEQAEKLSSLLSQKKEKEKSIKRTFNLSSNSPRGLEDIKSILSLEKDKQAEIHYLGASKFSIEKKSPNPKQTEKLLDEILEKIEEKAKQKHTLFSLKEK